MGRDEFRRDGVGRDGRICVAAVGPMRQARRLCGRARGLRLETGRSSKSPPDYRPGRRRNAGPRRSGPGPINRTSDHPSATAVRRLLQEPSADAVALELRGHVQIVEQSSPDGVVVKNHVGKADDGIPQFRNNGKVLSPRLGQAFTPDRKTVGKNVAVKERVQERTSIMSPPTVGVERGDAFDVFTCCVTIRKHFHRRLYGRAFTDLYTSGLWRSMKPWG